MMRFRCPHCRQILEVIQLTEKLLCPACEQWCRIPIPDEFELSCEPKRDIPPPNANVPFEPRLTPSEPPRVPHRESITTRQSEELPLRPRDELDEVEEVALEVVEDGDERRPKRRRRRRRRRSRGAGFDVDYWISPTSILLILLVPGGIFLVVLSFFLHPGAGFGALLMVVGGIWFTLIAAEDGMVTALLVLFVPFYAWYFAFVNFERVAVPFLITCVGSIIFAVSLIVAGIHAGEESSLPTRAPWCFRDSPHRAAKYGLMGELDRS